MVSTSERMRCQDFVSFVLMHNLLHKYFKSGPGASDAPRRFPLLP